MNGDLPEPRPRVSTPRVLSIITALWLVAALPYVTNAACDFWPSILLSGSGFLIGSTWLALSVFARWYFQRPPVVWWLSVPILLSTGIILAWTDEDLALRVAWSEDSLNRTVTAVRNEPDNDWHGRRVGTFWVNRVEEYLGGVYLFTSQSFIDCEGIARIPPGTPVAHRMRVRHLYGEWYAFVWHF